MRRNKLFRTASFRLALLYTALYTLSVLVMFGVTYRFAADYAAQDESSEIQIEYESILEETRLLGADQLPAIIDSHIQLRRNVQAAYLLQDTGGRKIRGNLEAMRPFLGPAMLPVSRDDDRRNMRAYGYRLANGDFLLIGQDTSTLHEMTALIARSFGVGLLVTLLLAVGGGALIASSVLGRVDAISRTSRAIIDGDLSRRVPLRGSGDEFDELAASINAMLDRIEDLMNGMRQVTSDIAHDLRTPLTRLRQRLEFALRHPADVSDLRKALESAIAQTESILETFGALLRIAQIEAGGNASPYVTLDISKLIANVVDDFSPSAEDRGHRLSADAGSSYMLHADRELVTQMIVNLVGNAIRHCPPGTDIRLLGRAAGRFFELTVADTGTGIPAAEREKVLRPFYRLESSRTTEGSGLGLSLVAAIAKQHRATLRLDDNKPGLCVTVTFPPAL